MIFSRWRRILFGTLRGRLVMGVAIVHAVMMAIFIVDLTARQRGMFLDRQAEEATALAHSLATSAASWIAANDLSCLQELVEVQRQYPELLFAILINQEGHVLAHTDRSQNGLYVLDLPSKIGQIMYSRTPALVDAAVPVLLGGRHVGWVRVGLGQKAARKKLAAITASGILYMMIAIVTGSVIAWLMGRHLTRRLYVIQDTINLVRTGNHLARSWLPGEDEAAHLAREFNTMLDILGESENEILRLNNELEHRVQLRTGELETTNKNLENAYEDLKTAQFHLLQQEKMASIGQLAAGVAHEINNPMGFIMSNLGTLRKYTERFAEFIGAQTEALAHMGPGAESDLASLQKLRKALKIDYLTEDTIALIGESLEGAERVRTIVQNLKSFSRLDKSELKMADLNDGIESTINIVWNELKYKATVVRNYGPIPLTRCNLGELNQVFMNLLVNAAQAIEKQGEIRVTTWVVDQLIQVAIADTGSGIAAEKINRIFEPFYTTKEVGKGTGLGLSIAYDIVKKHGGDITVTSLLGQGTTFTVKIPVVEG